MDNIPFYAETSIFQVWSAAVFAVAGALLFSVKREKWEYKCAGLIALYVAFDEHYMFHECIRLSNPGSRHYVGGDLTVFLLAFTGISGAIWAIVRLSEIKFESAIFILAAFICALEIYLDVYGKRIFYLVLDTEIEEISEMVLAFLLIVIALFAGVKKRVLVFIPLFLFLLFLPENFIYEQIWTICPRLRTVASLVAVKPSEKSL